MRTIHNLNWLAKNVIDLCGQSNKQKVPEAKDKFFRTLRIIAEAQNLYRDDWIRTSGPFVPNEVRYQAALHPAKNSKYFPYNITNVLKKRVDRETKKQADIELYGAGEQNDQ